MNKVLVFLAMSVGMVAQSLGPVPGGGGGGGGSGTVTSVSGPSWLTWATNTTTPTATVASQTQNTFLAAPNGSSGAATFRAMVAADVPTLNQNTSGSAGSVAVGGVTGLGTGVATWLATPTGANLTTALSSGGGTANFLRADGAFAAPAGSGTVTSIATTSPITGGTITTTGTIACATCVTSAVPLTSTALMTGAALQASQTPSATSTLDSSGNANFAGTVTTASLKVGASSPTCTSGTGGVVCLKEGTAATAEANADNCYGDSTLHGIKCAFNNGSFLNLPLETGTMTSGHLISVNATTNLIADAGVSLQGTDSNVLTSGTISGTAATLCTDANGGATTSGCSGGGTTSPAFWYVLGYPGYNGSSQTFFSNTTANLGGRIAFTIQGTVSSVYIYVYISTADAGKVAALGVYNNAMNSLLCSVAPFSTTSTGAQKLSWLSTCTLSPGSYYLVTTSDSTIAQYSSYYDNSAVPDISYNVFGRAGSAVSTGSGAGLAFNANLSAIVWSAFGSTPGVAIFALGN